MKTRRTRRTNIAINTVFDTFRGEVTRYENKKTTNVEFYVELIEQAENRLRNILFGMFLVDSMTYREYLILRERVHRETRQAVRNLRNWN